MPSNGATPDYKRRRKIAELRAKGLTYQAIGKQLGGTRQSIFSLAKQQADFSGEVTCKRCKAVIVRDGANADQDTYCLSCLEKHPEATFGERLKAFRVAAGMKRTDLARRAGLPSWSIAFYERSTSVDPQWSKVRRLALVLGVGLLGLEGLTDGNQNEDKRRER